jgi:hypothetical protein
MQSQESQDRTWMPSNAEERSLVDAELEEILASAPFRASNRYPALLRYVAQKTLLGDTSDLKERTIGIEVFHRQPDYDTNADPVVRFCAGEIRRRLAQFYQENSRNNLIEIELPVGGYIPQFHWKVTAKVDEASTKHNSSHPGAGNFLPLLESSPPELNELNHLDLVPATSYKVGRAAYPVAAVLAALLAVTGYFGYSGYHRRDVLHAVWEPLLTNPDEIVISTGRPHPEEIESPELPNTTIKQHILRPEFRVSLTTVAAISQIAGFLRTQHKDCRVQEAYSNKLEDFHDRPVVLINANNNKWTLLLLQPLRFRFVSRGDFTYIEDAEHPQGEDWNVDFNKPYSQQKVDYAIVGRFYDATTHGPVVVVAGISSNGTEAAGEFIVSPESLEALARDAHSSLSKNFEAVLKVEVIGGNTGAATVVAKYFW